MDTEVEFMFKCATFLHTPTELSLKNYLEHNIKGLVIQSIEQDAKQYVITSNLLSVMFGSEGQEELDAANKKLQVQVHILKGELAATNKLKDQLTKNYLAFKEKNPEINALTNKLKESLAECQKLNKTSAIAIEKNKALTKAMNQMEADKNTLIEDIKKFSEEILNREKELNKLVEYAEDLKDQSFFEAIRAYADNIEKLSKSITCMASQSIMEAFLKQDFIKKRKSSEIEDLYKNFSDTTSKENGMKVDAKSKSAALCAIKRELDEKCEEYAELEEAYKTLETEYQLAENQIEVLQISLDEKDKQIANLNNKATTSQAINENEELIIERQKVSDLLLELKKYEKVITSKDEQIKILTDSLEEKGREMKAMLDKDGMEVDQVNRSEDKSGFSTKSEIIQLKEELAQKKIKLTELSCKLSENEEVIKQKQEIVSEQSKELRLLKKRLGEFEILLDNPTILEEAKKQLKDSEANLKEAANESLSLVEQLANLKQQNETLLKEQVELKAALFEREQRLMQSDGGKDKGKKYKVLEEIKSLLHETLSTYVTMQTLVKEMKMIYSDKVNKVIEYEKALTQYMQENNKKERLKRCEELEDSLVFLGAIPKKIMNIGMLDKSVIETLKVKVGKAEEYRLLFERYEKLIGLINQRFAEYELKLSHY